jgi:hypothetical protein
VPGSALIFHLLTETQYFGWASYQALWGSLVSHRSACCCLHSLFLCLPKEQGTQTATSNFKQQQQQWRLPQGHRHPCKHNDCENNNSVATMRPSSNPFFMFALFSCCLSIVDYKNGKTTEEQSITTMVV